MYHEFQWRDRLEISELGSLISDLRTQIEDSYQVHSEIRIPHSEIRRGLVRILILCLIDHNLVLPALYFQ